MKIVFVSNFMNHHQLELCKKLYELTGGNLVFGACTPVPKERLDMGYHDMNKQYDFVLCAYESEENQAKLFQLVEEADVLIIGGLNTVCADKYVKRHLGEGKITFQYLERIYKTGVWHVLSPRGTMNMLKYHTHYRNDNVYTLCASAYTAWDLSLTRSYIDKTYKWGYFPKVHSYDIAQLIQKKSDNKKTSILWAGRLIDWKHPEDAIYVAKSLKADGYDFELNIVGNGVMEEEIARMIKDSDLSDCVCMRGAMSPEEVREYMEKSDIFLFTSDYNEGWGAVLNESMNSACAVVANHAIGSVGFLIEHRKNGLVYKNGNQKSLYSCVKELIDNPELRKQMGISAYQTMIDEWSPESAAERLIALSEALIKGDRTPLYQSGPCSASPRIGNRKMYKALTKK